MSYVVFDYKTGQIYRQYKTISGARRGMRFANKKVGWELMSRCNSNGIDIEWCRSTTGAIAPVNTYGYAPYAMSHESVVNNRFNTD